jgi:flagellar basal-body rod modification protein FlgD
MTVTGTNSNADTTDQSSAAKGTQKPSEKTMFMQLLVAQLKNQDPLSPSDGTEFIAQLAQFEQLEQSANTGQDITAIRKDLDALLGIDTTDGSTKQSQTEKS